MRYVVFALMGLLVGCSEFPSETGGGGGVGGNGGSGGMAEGGTGGGCEGAPEGTTLIGFGVDGSPVYDRSTSLVIRNEGTSAGVPVATKMIRIPYDGTIIDISVVHVVDDTDGYCNQAPRPVLLSTPVDENTVISPPIHEQIDLEVQDVESAPSYQITGIEDGRVVHITHSLQHPLQVRCGDRIALGSVLTEGACTLGGAVAVPDQEDRRCGGTWYGCGVDHLVLAGWANIAPE